MVANNAIKTNVLIDAAPRCMPPLISGLVLRSNYGSSTIEYDHRGVAEMTISVEAFYKRQFESLWDLYQRDMQRAGKPLTEAFPPMGGPDAKDFLHYCWVSAEFAPYLEREGVPFIAA